MTVEAAAMGEEVIKENLEQFLIVLSVSLGVATLSQISSFFRQIPYTLLLVIVGLGLAFVDIRLVNLSPELILEIFLPPLLFEAAWNIRWRNLKNNLFPVTLLAVIGVVISVVGIGFILNYFTDLSLPIALLIGASLAATDPVAVIALFRELGVGERLTVLMEGESLFNDGVAVVAFSLLVGIPMGVQEFSATDTVVQFVTFTGIGIGVGGLIGFGISYLTQRFDLPLVEQSLTLVSAYGAYLITEELGGSGVIGVVTVGLILGNFGSRIGMNPRTRLLVSEFWEFIAFFVNSIVFLLIGDQINIRSLADKGGLILVTILALLLIRAISIYGLGTLSNFVTKQDISWQEETVLWWGGLRGSVSIALALSVPVMLEGRQDIIEAVFGVVLFTLLVQGLTMPTVIEKLGLVGDRAQRQTYNELLARRSALERVLQHLETVKPSPNIDEAFKQHQQGLIQEQLDSVNQEITKLQQSYPQLRSLEQEQLQDQLLEVEADTYAEFIRSGKLNKSLTPLLQEVLSKEE
jgi:CPA1 family monovalent cation:H+ antiporter